MNLTELQNRANVLVEAVNDYESNLTGITVDENEILEQHIYLDTHSLCSIFNYIFEKNWSDKSTNNPESILTNDYPFLVDPCYGVYINPKDFKSDIVVDTRLSGARSYSLERNEYVYATQGFQNNWYILRSANSRIADISRLQRQIPQNSLHPYDAQLIESEVVNLRRIDTTAITTDTAKFGWLPTTNTGINQFTLPEVFPGVYGQPFLGAFEYDSPTNNTNFFHGTTSGYGWKITFCDFISVDNSDHLLLQQWIRDFKTVLPPFYHFAPSFKTSLQGDKMNLVGIRYKNYIKSTPHFGEYDMEEFNEEVWWDTVHTWFELATKQRRAGCKAAGVDFLPGSGDTDDQGVALAVILAHCKPVLENFYFPDNLEKFYSEDGSKAAELADLFLTTCDTDSDITDEAFFTTDNTTADTETGEQNTDRSCKNRFTYEMLANVYDLPL